MINSSLPPAYLQEIQRNRWFSSLPETIREELLSQVFVKALSKGEYLYRRGDQLSATQNGFCVLTQGRLKVSGLHSSGSEFILTILEPGHWFGDVPFLLDRPHTHDFTALEKCIFLSVALNKLAQLLLIPDFSIGLLRLMAGRMQQFSILLEDRCLLASNELVAKRLYQAARGDTAELQTPRAKISVPQDLLAAMVGITRQTLQKELRLLVEANIIACHYGYIDVLDFKKLEALARPKPK